MEDEEKPNPLLLGLITQEEPACTKTRRGEPNQANKKSARNRKAPLWMGDYFINNDQVINYSTPNTTLPTLPHLKRKANEIVHSPSTSNTGDKKDMENTLSCQLCQISCSGIASLRQHLEGRQHKAKMEDDGKLKRCEVCEIWCSDKNALEMHFKGRKHKARLEVNGGGRVLKTPVLCKLCLVYCMNEDLYEMHLKGKKHAAREDLKRRGMVPNTC